MFGTLSTPKESAEQAAVVRKSRHRFASRSYTAFAKQNNCGFSFDCKKFQKLYLEEI